MFQAILNWLRRSVRDAFLAGVQDAVAELDKGGAGEPEAAALESLKARFALTEEKPKRKAS